MHIFLHNLQCGWLCRVSSTDAVPQAAEFLSGAFDYLLQPLTGVLNNSTSSAKCDKRELGFVLTRPLWV